jgi:hypothetical protein
MARDLGAINKRDEGLREQCSPCYVPTQERASQWGLGAEWAPLSQLLGHQYEYEGAKDGNNVPIRRLDLGRIQKEQVRRRRRRDSNVPGRAFSHGNGPISGKGEENGPMRWLGSGERVRPSC